MIGSLLFYSFINLDWQIDFNAMSTYLGLFYA